VRLSNNLDCIQILENTVRDRDGCDLQYHSHHIQSILASSIFVQDHLIAKKSTVTTHHTAGIMVLSSRSSSSIFIQDRSIAC
jgi:hypothetical protein